MDKKFPKSLKESRKAPARCQDYMYVRTRTPVAGDRSRRLQAPGRRPFGSGVTALIHGGNLRLSADLFV